MPFSRIFHVVLALGFLALPATAGTLCGAKTHQKFGETRIYAKDFIATCRPDGSCAAVTYRNNPGTMRDQAPLGWDHRLSVSRKTADGPWQVILTAVVLLPDLSEGIIVKVDRNDDMRVPFEFLATPGAVNDVAVDTKLSDVLIPALKGGAKAVWSYKSKGGQDGQTAFSLRGLTRAMKWIACAQPKLAAQ